MPEKIDVDHAGLQPGQYQAVAWDLDTTGRRLIDEICQIGGQCYDRTKADEEVSTFSQYVMPYRNPNPGARRSFGIKVVNIGRYRMLKDMASGKILKTKSEVSALQDFISWLEQCKGDKAGILLVCHEPQRKVLVPLLLEALIKYRLLESFQEVVSGFCNSAIAVEKLGDKNTITSLSLRSLCKTLLGDTTLSTNSASERSTVLSQILAKVTGEGKDDQVADILLPYSVTVDTEKEQLNELKNVLGTQGTLRPIFESQLKQKRLVRERAMILRRTIAEAGLDYASLRKSVKDGSLRDKLLEVEASKEDMEEIIKLVGEHFNSGEEENLEAVNCDS